MVFKVFPFIKSTTGGEETSRVDNKTLGWWFAAISFISIEVVSRERGMLPSVCLMQNVHCTLSPAYSTKSILNFIRLHSNL